VGKFGVGFNAVYGVTEVPSVYSDHVLALLDPHERYLDGQKGRKLDFNLLMNQKLLKKMPNQFKTFQVLTVLYACNNRKWFIEP
jgi:sacsin